MAEESQDYIPRLLLHLNNHGVISTSLDHLLKEATKP